MANNMNSKNGRELLKASVGNFINDRVFKYLFYLQTIHMVNGRVMTKNRIGYILVIYLLSWFNI